MISAQHLEELLGVIVRENDAAGAVLLIISKDQRAEVVAAFSEHVDDLPSAIHRLADEIESGSGTPIGRHGQKI